MKTLACISTLALLACGAPAERRPITSVDTRYPGAAGETSAGSGGSAGKGHPTGKAGSSNPDPGTAGSPDPVGEGGTGDVGENTGGQPDDSGGSGGSHAAGRGGSHVGGGAGKASAGAAGMAAGAAGTGTAGSSSAGAGGSAGGAPNAGTGGDSAGTGGTGETSDCGPASRTGTWTDPAYDWTGVPPQSKTQLCLAQLARMGKAALDLSTPAGCHWSRDINDMTETGPWDGPWYSSDQCVFGGVANPVDLICDAEGSSPAFTAEVASGFNEMGQLTGWTVGGQCDQVPFTATRN